MVILYGGKIREEGTCDDLLTSEGKSIIEAEALDDPTIAEIDEVIRRRTSGRSAITRVSKPRQKLEDKFISIVERAMEDRVETSGARHGGETAAFLRAGEAPDGAGLIEALVKASDEPAAAAPVLPAPATASPAPRAGEADHRVIEALTGGDDRAGSGGGRAAAESSGGPRPPTSPARPAPAAPAPAPARASAADVDQSVIDSLLGGEPGGAGPKPGGAR